MIYAVIPTGSRPAEYKYVIDWLNARGITPITIATSAEAHAYATGLVITDSTLNISRWWNLGIDLARKQKAEHIFILNDDVVLPDDWADLIVEALEGGYAGASGERGDGLIQGYAFGLNGSVRIRADEELVWWYGDDDIQRQCEQAGGFAIIPGLTPGNRYAFVSSYSRKEQIALDKAYYKKKWGIDVTVVVATHGSGNWKYMGDQAAHSALETGAKVVRVHLQQGTVAEARNAGLAQVTTEWVVFLDADDALDPDYFERVKPTADVMATQIKYRHSYQPMMPKVWQHENIRGKLHAGYCSADCLIDGNWVHIGAIVRTDAVRSIGGFKEYPVYEDWALFLELQQAGYTFDRAMDSVYLAGIRLNDSHRNSSLPLIERNKIHERIYRDLVK